MLYHIDLCSLIHAYITTTIYMFRPVEGKKSFIGILEKAVYLLTSNVLDGGLLDDETRWAK